VRDGAHPVLQVGPPPQPYRGERGASPCSTLSRSASIVPILDIKVDVDQAKSSALIHAVSGKVRCLRHVGTDEGFAEPCALHR
jgi:hypothetical protein